MRPLAGPTLASPHAPPPLPDECYTDLAVGEVQEFITGLPDGSEGITFDAEGNLFITAEHSKVFKVGADGELTELAETPDAVVIAADADGNLFIAGWGALDDLEVADGLVYKVTPAGDVTKLFEGSIINANFVTRTPWGSWLISDDTKHHIWEMQDDGTGELWSELVATPNGMVFSADGSTLYVANTFSPDSEVYAIIVENKKAKSVEILANLNPGTLNDGLAMDREGWVYVAANAAGAIVKISPEGEVITVVDSLFSPASLAFGEGDDFDPCSIYVTSLRGDKVWRIAVGVPGLPPFRE